jgi:C4-dicarboxylate-specific signal transduction histidine kinase
MRQSVLNELSGSIAHELNQPLTAILSNAEAAQGLLSAQKVDRGKLGDILHDIITEDTRAADVISRVRQLLKKGDSQREAVNIDNLIDSTLALLNGELVKRKIAVDVKCSPGLAVVSGDLVQLQQVLINLLVNAMDAMTSVLPIDREIRIRANSNKDKVEIIISDRGHGLSAEIHDKLFQPFVSTKEQGLGLGLSICATILKAHSGKIAIKNNADRGAIVILTLPALNALVPAQ